jgi:serine phosphatase RsbU (regulator of sigma subunit)
MYFTMVKKIETILGITAAILFVMGVIFVFLHLPGTSILLGLSMLIFNLGYLPLQLIREHRMVSSLLDRSYLVFRFLTLFIIMFGFVFKIQHWPGAGLLLLMSTYMIPLLITFYFFMRIKGAGKIPFQWNDVIIAILAYTIHIFITRTLVTPNIVNAYVNLEEQYSKLNAGLNTANKLIYSSLDSATDSGNMELIEAIRELRDISNEMILMTDTLKSGFISSFYNNPLDDAFDPVTADRALLASTSESMHYFLEKPRGADLKNALADYMKAVEQISGKHNLPSSLMRIGFELDDITDPWGNTHTWEEHIFRRAPIAAVLASLSWIQQMILLTERGIQNQLSGLLSEKEMFRMLQELATSESTLAMDLKENEILRISQQKELQKVQLEKSQSELDQRNIITATALAGIVFVLILLAISTRAFMLKQKDNKMLALQKDEISGKHKELSMRNEEILAQRDEIEAQRDEIEAQRNTVFKQKEEIELTHNEISASMDYAMRLQDTILPSLVLLEEHFSDHLIFYRPKQKVSGDFYWWTRSGSSLIIAVADCTGHGVPGAFMSLLGAGLLKEIVSSEGITEPGRILDRLREEVISALCQQGTMGEQKDGMEMAVLNIDTESQKCQYAGARSPLYLLRRSKLSICRPNLMPISWHQEMHPFDTVDIQLEPSDQLYMFSDGYVDQFGGEHRKKFKYKAFRQVLTEHADLSMSRQQQVLSDTIREWQGENEQTDDMVIIGIKI